MTQQKEPLSFAEYVIHGVRAIFVVLGIATFGWLLLILYGIGRLAEKCGLPPERGWC